MSAHVLLNLLNDCVRDKMRGLITFSNSLDPYQDRQFDGSDLDPNILPLK